MAKYFNLIERRFNYEIKMISYGIFCTPQQLLVFIPIVVGISTLTYHYGKELQGKTLKIVVVLTLLSYFLILTNSISGWFFTFSSGLFGFLILSIIFVILLWRKKHMIILLFSAFLISYLISGIIGNACLFLPVEHSSLTVYPKQTTIGIIGLGQYMESVPCSLRGIGINEFGFKGERPEGIINPTNEVFVSFFDYESRWEKPYKTVILEKGQDLTFCCSTWTLVDLNETNTFWITYSKFDVFCSVQNLFSSKGVYRTDIYNEGSQKSGGGITQTSQSPKPTVSTKDILIEKFEMDKKIYVPGEKITVDFTIRNTLQIPYNISVDWFHNYTRYPGWFNKSTEIYKVTDEINGYYTWIILYPRGDWEVQLVVNYDLGNKSYTKSNITSFKVI